MYCENLFARCNHGVVKLLTKMIVMVSEYASIIFTRVDNTVPRDNKVLPITYKSIKTWSTPKGWVKYKKYKQWARMVISFLRS